MEIDWFTVIAQVVNFLVLVWLLQRFLYGPIVNAMDAREERIAEKIQSAEALKAEAIEEAEAYRQKQADLERRTDAVLDEAEREATERRRELLERAREEVERVKDEWYASLRREQRSVLDDVRARTEHQLFAAIRQVLEDLADEDLERRIIEVFIDKVEGAEESELPELDAADADAKLSVRTSLELEDAQRDRIIAALEKRFGEAVRPTFRVDEDLVGGVEVRFDGRRFGWSIRQYLDSLEHTLDAQLRARLERPDSGKSDSGEGETDATVGEERAS